MKHQPLLALIVTLLLCATVLADVPGFAEGDRVEVDINMTTDPATGHWRGAVIKKVDRENNGYWVELDGQPGQDRWIIIPFRGDRWTRRAAGAPAATVTTAVASGDSPGFAVGDRVEVDVHMTQDPATGHWRNAVIKKVDREPGAHNPSFGLRNVVPVRRFEVCSGASQNLSPPRSRPPVGGILLEV